MRRFRSFREGGIGCPSCNPPGFNMSPCVIPDFGKDHNYWDSLDQGEDPRTNQQNYPAIWAARTAGGTAFPHTVHNGVNATYNGHPSRIAEINPKFRKLYNGRESDAYHHESVCDILSRLSESYY